MRFTFLLPLITACVPFHHDDSQHVARMCVDRNYAYETGYNVGLNRGALSTSWVNRCAPERADSIRTAYRSGYETGIANAPIMVKGQYSHTVNGRYDVDHRHRSSGGSFSSSYASSSECTFSSDCGDGQTCRSGVCYGNGWAGDACVFSSDCISNDCDISTKTCD